MSFVAGMTQIGRAFKSKGNEGPFDLLLAFIKERREDSKDEQKEQFTVFVTSGEYEEMVTQIVREWTSMKLAAALRAADPPDVASIRRSMAAKREAVSERAALVDKAKNILGARLMEMVMPDGRVFGDCKREDCRRLGGMFATIGAKLGPDQRVRDVLSIDQLAIIAQRSGLENPKSDTE